jgi:CheY-like chemotaxis protein
VSIQLKSVLYVEDKPANIKLIKRIVARNTNLKLFATSNGIDGVEIAQKILQDLILMDINLPGISRLDALKMLQSNKIK